MGRIDSWAFPTHDRVDNELGKVDPTPNIFSNEVKIFYMPYFNRENREEHSTIGYIRLMSCFTTVFINKIRDYRELRCPYCLTTRIHCMCVWDVIDYQLLFGHHETPKQQPNNLSLISILLGRPDELFTISMSSIRHVC